MASSPALHLSLKGEYFDAIKSGEKVREYRLVTEYWKKRLDGRCYTEIVLTKGYPASTDHERRLRRAWRGFDIQTITHPHFGADPVAVYAIDVSEAA